MKIAKLLEGMRVDEYPNYILISKLLKEVINNAKPHKRQL